MHIESNRNNFRFHVGKAYFQVYKKRDYKEGQRIVSENVFKGHTKYEELKSSEMRMEYLKIIKDKSKFRESLDYFNEHAKFMKENPFYREFYEQGSAAIPLNRYEDLVALYMNCK